MSKTFDRCICGALGLLVFIFFWAPSARANPITFSFTGLVTQTNFDPSDPFSGSIVFGTPFTGTYTFQSDAVDADPSASGGSYTSSPGSLSVTIGGNALTAS